jgi:hypothetical protein
VVKDERSARPDVRRVTIDEKLADDLIRAAICRLADGVEVFYDRQGDWGRERGAWFRPGDYARKMGLDPEQAPAWGSLKEGQVFLVGEFATVDKESKTSCFKVDRTGSDMVRIDSLKEYRDGVKYFYAYLLEEGGRHGESR